MNHEIRPSRRARPTPVNSLTARSGVAWVRSDSELNRSLPDLNAFFETRRLQRSAILPLRGIWVGRGDGGDDPCMGQLGVTLASVQLFGLWSLIWMEDASVGRGEILDMLVQHCCSKDGGPNGRFRPVYQTRDEEAEREQLALEQRYPGLVGEPLFQEPWSGRLAVESEELESAM